MHIKTKVTLTVLTKHLNTTKAKKSGEPFTTSDVQGYIRRGRLPNYLGGQTITLSTEIEGVKLYNIGK